MDNKILVNNEIKGGRGSGSDESIPSTIDSNKDTVRMERTIGLFGGIALIVGTMIGSGIFISPTGLLEGTNSSTLSLIVWAGCGVLATMAALSYCELGTVVPRSGGEHAYYMATFTPLSQYVGELPGFLYAWVTVLLLNPSTLAVNSLAFGKYALYPILRMDRYNCDGFKDGTEYDMGVKLLAAVIAALICAVNIFSAKWATKAAIVFLISKISTMAIMIGIGFYNLGKGDLGALEGGWDPTNKTVGDIANSFYSGLWAYGGWNNLNFVIEEVIDPHRNLPLAIIIGIPVTTVLYILINVSYLTALTKGEMINSEAVAVDVGDKYLGVVKLLIPILVTIAAIGTGNGTTFAAGRIAYAVGRDGHMVDVMSYVHAKRLTPVVALIVNLILAYIMIFASEIQNIINLFGFASWIVYGLAIACVIILRFTKPDAPRPFKVPIIIPVIALIMSIALVILPLVYDPKIDYVAVVGFFIVGAIIYVPFIYKKYRLPYMDEFTHFIQYLTLAAPSPYKED